MRTTDERMAAVQRRAKELEQEKQQRRGRILGIASFAASLTLIVGISLFMPGMMEDLQTVKYVSSGAAASIFYQNAALGYVLIGVLAFALGVCVTILCHRIHLRSIEQQDKVERDD